MAAAETTVDLLEQRCQPCTGGTPPLAPAAITPLKRQLAPAWKVISGAKLSRIFTFDSFPEAMVFVNDVAALAEDEGHHPDITINYSKVLIELTTHAIHGLSANDFILARKIEMCS